ncbi:hypothetical protein FSP39_008568 [Pinctada imbricata]|uniref:Protein kinase domain-containing protein n=1 Tax=Pinctada imbricata TaxID=66713 RepID=A0AA88Y5H1_PINIB|nr:hypothetical protein FSP39_008568 [Pinctada imbricata]
MHICVFYFKHPSSILGEVSSGKSTFINNLIGEDLLPSKLQHSTAVICRIRNSEEKVIQLTDGHGQVVKTIECDNATEARGHLMTYADKNQCQTDCMYSYVDILWPVPFLNVSKDGEMKIMITLTDKYSRASAPYHCHGSIKSITRMKVYKGEDDVFPSLFESTHATSQKYGIGKNTSDFRKSEPDFDEYPVLPTHIAPEFIMGIERLYTREADMYSLGILLWEITYDIRAYVCHTPLAPTSTLEEFLNFLHRGGRPDLWKGQLNPNQLKKVIESSWQQDPKRRSSAHDILERLKQMKAAEKTEHQASLCDFLSSDESDM